MLPMGDTHGGQPAGEPIAIVGMACRFPEADSLAEFLELVLTCRRAFRRLPPVRLDARGYTGTEPGGTGLSALGPGVIGPARAALIEGWRFDRAAFGITDAAYRAADPAHWLALETAARALSDAGFPGGQGITRDRTGVIIGNTLTGEVSRANAMRSRWPYVRQVLRDALAAEQLAPGQQAGVIEHAAAGFLGRFPDTGEGSPAGGLPSAIADRICGHFGLRGGGHAVDAAHSSSLLAVAAACSALAAGDLDTAIAGGVDISLDPFEFACLAETGALAAGEMRVFDARPTGFLPGEGCGLAVLMRAADARAAGIPVYAEIAGWGVSSAGNTALGKPGSASLLLALRRAYHRAGIDPADIQVIEGDGTGTASGDLAELTSLAEIRQESPSLAALGSVKANIGHTKAAAGVAGLIKATLAVSAGVIPPATGCVRPHALIASEDARLRLPESPEPWPERTRLAGVSSVGPGGTSVHLILRRTKEGRRRRAPAVPSARAGSGAGGQAAGSKGATRGGRARTLSFPVTAPTPSIEIFAFSAADHRSLAAELSRVADIAHWLSDAEMHDLACQAGLQAGQRETLRVALVAGTQDELARRAREAAELLPGLAPGKLTALPGIYAAERGRGRAVLLFPGESGSLTGHLARPSAGGPGTYDTSLHPAIVAASLARLRWLAKLGLVATAGLGHGLGEITALVWAGCLSGQDAARLVAQRAAVLAAQPGERTAMLRLDAGGETAERLCTRTGLVIAAYNGPRCHLLAGPAGVVRDLAGELAGEGIPATVLDSPQAFYSPAMADRVPPLRSIMREYTFSPPRRTVWSTTTGKRLTSGDDIASLLCDQMVSPVRFAGPLAAAAADADLLIETGPGQSLSLLAADCCDVPALSLGGPPEEEAAAQVAAALFAAGAISTVSPLLTGRAARRIDIWRERIFIPSPCGAAAEGALPTSIPPPRAASQASELAPGGSERGARRRAGLGSEPGGPGSPPAASGQEWRPGGGEGQEKSAGGPPGPARGAPAKSAGVAQGGQEPAARSSQGPAARGGRAVAAADVPGIGPWFHCFRERTRPAEDPGPAARTGPWRLRVLPRQPFAAVAYSLFEEDPHASSVLTVVDDPAERGTGAMLLGAAKEAAGAGGLVVISPVPGLTGFCASLHAEHPGLGLTLIRAPLTEEGLAAAKRFAAVVPGRFRQVRLDGTGHAAEPVMVRTSPEADGTFPLGPADVILVTGMTRAGDLACATALASRGAALAVIAAPGPEDPQLAGCLADLRAAGVRVSRKKADLTDGGQVAAAVRSLERGLGPVTAVVHATGAGPVERCDRLPEQVLRNFIVGQRIRLGNVLGTVAAERVRVLVTFGSVAARYGAVGGACEALASAGAAQQAAAFAGRAAGTPGGPSRCQVLHVDWAPWAGQEPASEASAAATVSGPLAGFTPISVEEGSRLLLAILTSSAPPDSVAAHGRLGLPGAAAFFGGQDRPQPDGRFLETVRVHYPGVELVADAKLSPRTDPYLADHQIYELPVFPPVMALEAMAQAASAVAGTPLRQVADVTLAAPVVLPAAGELTRGALVRVCALAREGRVETVLRSAETGFLVDHARAEFRPATGLPEAAETGGEAAASKKAAAGEGTAGSMAPGAIVDGTDLYGEVFFAGGRFRRVAFLPEVSSRACRALVRGGDSQPWFEGLPGFAGSPLILGSPGLNDAALHLLQACLPHRRVLPAALRGAVFSGREICGALQVRAVRLPGDRGWDITAADATGQPVVTWAGVRLSDVGPLAPPAGWHPALLAVALEAQAAGLGPDPTLRAVITSGRYGPGPLPPPSAPAPGRDRAEAPWADCAAGQGPLDGFELAVRAEAPVACRWEAAGYTGSEASGPAASPDPDHGLAALRGELTAWPGHSEAAALACFRAVAACLAALGREPGAPCAAEPGGDGDWLTVRSAGIGVTCTIATVSGIPGQVAVAIASRPGAPGHFHDHGGVPAWVPTATTS